jgi:hypothetical protein
MKRQMISIRDPGMKIHLESLYVTSHRNSPHRVTDIVTIFWRILYFFWENSVRFCTVVGAASAPPRYRILYKSTVVRRIRAAVLVSYMHRNSAHIIGECITQRQRIL